MAWIALGERDLKDSEILLLSGWIKNYDVSISTLAKMLENGTP